MQYNIVEIEPNDTLFAKADIQFSIYTSVSSILYDIHNLNGLTEVVEEVYI